MTTTQFLQFSKISDFICKKEIHARNMLKPLAELFERQLENKQIDDYFFNYSFSIYPKISGNEDEDHCLIDHTSLTLEEILKIKRFDIDVTVELDY